MARDIKEGRLSGFVGHGTTLTGETEFHAMLRVDGHLIGTVASEAGTLDHRDQRPGRRKRIWSPQR